jgi:hypothetical protein
MIIRISGDAQYKINSRVLDEHNAADDDLEAAVKARDHERFRRALSRLLALVRDTGERLDVEHLAPSDLILPPDDISLHELAGELSIHGLIPN